MSGGEGRGHNRDTLPFHRREINDQSSSHSHGQFGLANQSHVHLTRAQNKRAAATCTETVQDKLGFYFSSFFWEKKNILVKSLNFRICHNGKGEFFSNAATVIVLMVSILKLK